MRIDWITVGAQIVNFLVLVWLLHRFLYGPVTRAMAGRERRIAERIAAAERQQEEAGREAESYRGLQRAFEERRAAMMTEARGAAAGTRQALEEAAREEVDERRRGWLDELETQQDRFLRELRQAAAERFWALARRALADLADETLEERMAAAFARQVEALDEATAEAVAAAAAREEAVVVRSRFALPAPARRAITRAVHERLRLETAVEYREAPTLDCGIELLAGGRVLRWGLAEYLERFEAEVAERLAEARAAP